MAANLAMKLAITAAALGCATRKDLARAFAKANGNTSFDLDRSYKWLQGRAQPRDSKLYAEWLDLLGLQRSKDWLLNCTSEEFLAGVAEELNKPSDAIWQLAADFLGEEAVEQGSPMGLRRQLEGVFAVYSWAWSPYHVGRLIRGTLMIAPWRKPGRTQVIYSETLQGVLTRMQGSTYDSGQSLFLNLLHEEGELPLFFSMYRPSPPTSVMMGHLCGAALMGPNPPPSATRIIMLRVPAPWATVETSNRYLESQETVVSDLIKLGLRPADPAALEAEIQIFLRGAPAGGADQLSGDVYHGIIAHLDPLWLERSHASEPDPAAG